MSDNTRTSLQFTEAEEAADILIKRLADYFQHTGIATVIPTSSESIDRPSLFRSIEDASGKFTEDEGAFVISEEEDLILAARKFKNFQILTSFHLEGRAFPGSIYFYTGQPWVKSSSPGATVRLSFESSLIAALRGTKDFGTGATIDRSLKSSFLSLIFGLSKVLCAKGFIYALERQDLKLISLSALEDFVLKPNPSNSLFGSYLIGLQKSIVSRPALVEIWGDENAVKQSTTGFVILDILQDSESITTEDDEQEAGEEDEQEND